MGEQVVAELHRLGPLQVGVPGEVGIAGGIGAGEQHLLERQDRLGHLAQGALRVEPQVGGDLVVAAAAGVDLAAGGTGDLGDPPFDGGVDVLVGRAELEGAAGELLLHLVERGEDRRRLLTVEQAAPHQPAHVGARAGDVVGCEPLVVGQRDGVGEQLLGRSIGEPAVPQRLAVALGEVRHQLDGRLEACRADHVSMPRPQSRTNPAESSWRNVSAAS